MGGKSNIVRLENGFERTIIRQKELGQSEFCVLLDADVLFAPYETLGEERKGMRSRAKTLQATQKVKVVVLWAVREFESWLIGGLRKGDRFCGLAGVTKAITGDTQAAPRDPKQWVREHTQDWRYSSETQHCLASHVDWTQAKKRNKSLRDFLRQF